MNQMQFACFTWHSWTSIRSVLSFSSLGNPCWLEYRPCCPGSLKHWQCPCVVLQNPLCLPAMAPPVPLLWGMRVSPKMLIRILIRTIKKTCPSSSTPSSVLWKVFSLGTGKCEWDIPVWNHGVLQMFQKRVILISVILKSIPQALPGSILAHLQIFTELCNVDPASTHVGLGICWFKNCSQQINLKSLHHSKSFDWAYSCLEVWV